MRRHRRSRATAGISGPEPVARRPVLTVVLSGASIDDAERNELPTEVLRRGLSEIRARASAWTSASAGLSGAILAIVAIADPADPLRFFGSDGDWLRGSLLVLSILSSGASVVVSLLQLTAATNESVRVTPKWERLLLEQQDTSALDASQLMNWKQEYLKWIDATAGHFRLGQRWFAVAIGSFVIAVVISWLPS